MSRYILSSAIAMVITLGTASTVSTQATTAKSTQQASIMVNNQVFAKGVPAFVKHGTVWMPIDTVIRAIRAMSDDVTYDGKTLLINNLALQTESLKPQNPGTIDIADGGFVEDHVPVEIVKSGTSDVTYVPVWYVMHTMTQGSSGAYASWKNGRLTLEDHALGVPSSDEIDRVMASAVESSAKGATGEHFVLTGKPVSVTAPNGDTVTAAIGSRSPSADGYGQVVFFFHNRQFVGLDSNDEKTSIRSVKPAGDGGMSFNVTYANYAWSDPLYSPSLPLVTVTFAWDGTRFSPIGKASIPSGATNGLRVHVNPTLSSANVGVPSAPKDAKQAIETALPKGATLVNRPGTDSPYLSVDLDGNGHYDYAAAYSDGSTRQTGVMVVDQENGKWSVLLNRLTDGTELREFNAGAMTGDGTDSIAIQSYVGDGANDVTY
ncbi:LppP/LprE family lipoprotein [Alicyclobacillus dauci]|uniref:LppP/LprE family lipoprotein n=1 Tax=Alicyclobacillus dauci TaxID=1475485 RepID=A0ABY6Z0B1_9BACL|nr:LppP/LprE family lipoprotein [Alicyclobacillus dauci]WAH36323.1 LppP/LprE family lipoprotein [Alicyclobacillus dauci]